MNKAEYLEGYHPTIQRWLNPGYVTPGRAREIRGGIQAARNDLRMAEAALDGRLPLRRLDRYLHGAQGLSPLARKAYDHTIVRAAMRKYEREEAV